jgi:hypothetical protein
VVTVSGALILLPRGTVDWPTISLGARVTIASVALAVTASSLVGLSLPLAVLGAGCAYLLGILALRVLSPEDLLTARRLLRDGLARYRARRLA